jgi:hypothetical protein
MTFAFDSFFFERVSVISQAGVLAGKLQYGTAFVGSKVYPLFWNVSRPCDG